MLTFSEQSPKGSKSEKMGVYTGILHLAPATLSGFNTCQTAISQNLDCLKYCLNTAGCGGIFKPGESTNAIQKARIRRTQMFFTNRGMFFAELIKDINKVIRKADKLGMVPAIRLNGTSDLPWESIKHNGQTLMELFPNVQFYDYTKSQKRMLDYMAGAFPVNCHLTLSVHEKTDLGIMHWILNNGGNVATIFHKLPESWHGFSVINADESDARFLDPKGVVSGLTAKGNAKKDNSPSIF